MRMSYLLGVGSCTLAAAMLAAPSAAEPVQTVLTADTATVGLWRFHEGQGDRVACEVKAPPALLHGATWVPGREGYALATDRGHATIADDPALRPQHALTVEVWVKLARPGGDLFCKNSVYMIRLGNSSMTALVGLDGAWRTIQGCRPVPVGRWTHLALTYDSATRTAATYIDGLLDARQQFPQLTPGLLNQGRAALLLGTNDWNPLGKEVDGKIDALRISNIARSFEPLSPPGKPAPAARPAPGGNLVPNGDFALGLMGWRLAGEGDAKLLWGTAAKESASGRLCLRTLVGADASQDLRERGPHQALLSRPIAVQPGMHTPSVPACARMPRAARPRSRPRARRGRPRQPRAGHEPSAELGTDWKLLSCSFTLPDDWTAPSLCVRIDPARDGQLWVDDVRLIAGQGKGTLALCDKIGVAAKVESVGNLFFAGRAAETPLRIVNWDTKGHRVAIRTSIIDWDGKQLPAVAVGTFDVPAGGTSEASLAIDTGRRGTFRLGFELSCEGQTWRQAAELKYAVIVPLRGVGNAEDSVFGMNTHMEREPTAHLARNMEVLSQCGVKWIRGWWGWGMCEKEPGKFDWSEYDRQFNTVTAAQMRIMPILLRYYSTQEQAWTGPISKRSGSGQSQAPIQEYPYDSVLPEWSVWVGEIAARYKGRIGVYEIWNEPTMGSSPHGVLTPQQYAALLNHSTPVIRQQDPQAKVVGFAGVPLPFLKNTLALGTAPLMDVVSEHSYSQIERPEANLPKQTAAVRTILAAHGGDKPIWHTEQGVGGDDDGYLAPSLSEADVAALYTRNVVTLRRRHRQVLLVLGPDQPGLRLGRVLRELHPAAAAGCVERLRLVPGGHGLPAVVYAGQERLRASFPGRCGGVRGLELERPARLLMSRSIASLRAFDLMGNEVRMEAGGGGMEVSLAAERPVYLRCPAADRAVLEEALAAAKMIELDAVAVTARPVAGGVQVTLTGARGPRRTAWSRSCRRPRQRRPTGQSPSISTRWPTGRAARYASPCRQRHGPRGPRPRRRPGRARASRRVRRRLKTGESITVARCLRRRPAGVGCSNCKRPRRPCAGGARVVVKHRSTGDHGYMVPAAVGTFTVCYCNSS